MKRREPNYDDRNRKSSRERVSLGRDEGIRVRHRFSTAIKAICSRINTTDNTNTHTP